MVSVNSVILAGKDLSKADPIKCTSSGVGHIPEDRMGMGLIGGASLVDNSILREYRGPPISRGIFVERGAAAGDAAKLLQVPEEVVGERCYEYCHRPEPILRHRRLLAQAIEKLMGVR